MSNWQVPSLVPHTLSSLNVPRRRVSRHSHNLRKCELTSDAADILLLLSATSGNTGPNLEPMCTITIDRDVHFRAVQSHWIIAIRDGSTSDPMLQKYDFNLEFTCPCDYWRFKSAFSEAMIAHESRNSAFDMLLRGVAARCALGSSQQDVANQTVAGGTQS